jgi:acyl-CoA thioester hydrolase
MPRIKIELPNEWSFSTSLPVRVTDINYGNHMGNDAFLGLLHEARMQWLGQFGWTELISERTGLIMVEIEVRLKSQAVYGDELRISVAPVNFGRMGFDLVYLAENAATGTEVARARTGMVFFDYTANKLAAMPEGFKARLEKRN